MNFGKLAVSRALQDQNLGPILERNVRPDMLPDPEDRDVLKFVLDFHSRHRQVPSPGLVEQQFPGYSLGYAPDPVSFYVDEILKIEARNRLIDTFLGQLKNVPTTTDPYRIATAIRSELNQIVSLGEERREKMIGDDADDRWDEYQDRKNGVGLIGIPTPWSSLDDLTLGWLEEMYFGFAGRPGTGKTWVMLLVGVVAMKAGCSVLFVNKELPDDMMSRRFDALYAGINYERLRTGMLTTAEEDRFKRHLELMKTNPPASWWWLHGASTVSGIAAKIEEHDPDLVLIDGVYLLRDEEGAKQRWERYENISRGIKGLAQSYKVPIGISIQLSRTGDTKKNKTVLTLSDIMGSDAFAQDVDILVGMEQNDDLAANNEMKFVPLKSREAKAEPWISGWDFDHMEFVDKGTVITVVDEDELDEDEEVLDID